MKMNPKKIQHSIVESDQFFLPRYNELTAFLLTISLLSIIAINNELRAQLFILIKSPAGGLFLIFLSFIIIPPLWNIIFNRWKNRQEKYLLLLTCIITNYFASLVSSFYIMMVSDISNLYIVFPIINIISGMFYLILFIAGIYKADYFDEKEISTKYGIIGMVIILAVTIILNQFTSQQWPITLSITTAVSSYLSKFFTTQS